MTHLKTTTAALAALIAATSADAQARKNCAPRDRLLEKLAVQFSETRQSIGLGGDNRVVEVFAGETGSWTIIVTMPTGLSCVMAAGRSFENLSEKLPAKGSPV